MGKKSKNAEASSDNRNWVPGWIGGVTSPIVQRSSREWHRETLRNRVLAFEAARRSGENAQADAPIFRR